MTSEPCTKVGARSVRMSLRLMESGECCGPRQFSKAHFFPNTISDYRPALIHDRPLRWSQAISCSPAQGRARVVVCRVWCA